jgi:protein disulfide-isomerase-like protein
MLPVALSLALLIVPSPVLAGMYGEHVVALDANNFQKEVVESASTWFIKFYAPWCGHCKSSAPAFSKAAKKLDGVAKFGVVNCDDEKELPSKYKVQGFPTIKVFKGEGKKARRPSDYNGGRNAKELTDHAKYVMSGYIVRVKGTGLGAFLRDERQLPHVLLFTDKTTTSPLYKGMSAEFRSLASFGEVRKNDAGSLLEMFNVDTFPTLLSLKAGETEPQLAVRHVGGMDPKSLRAYFATVTKGVEPASADGSGPAEPTEPIFTQPKAFKAEFIPIRSSNEYTETCGARKDGRMCGLAFLPGGASHALADGLNAVADKFQYDNLAFAVIDTTGEDGGGAALASEFGIEEPSRGGFIVVRSRKNKFAALDANSEVSVDAVVSFLNLLVGGGARFKAVKADLRAWGSADVNEPDAADAEATEQEGGGTASQDNDKCGTAPPSAGQKCGSATNNVRTEL